MSIASEISRLQTAKAGLKTAIEGKGVTVPSDATLDDYPDLVDAISGGGGGTETRGTHGYIRPDGFQDLSNIDWSTVPEGLENWISYKIVQFYKNDILDGYTYLGANDTAPQKIYVITVKNGSISVKKEISNSTVYLNLATIADQLDDGANCLLFNGYTSLTRPTSSKWNSRIIELLFKYKGAADVSFRPNSANLADVFGEFSAQTHRFVFVGNGHLSVPTGPYCFFGNSDCSVQSILIDNVSFSGQSWDLVCYNMASLHDITFKDCTFASVTSVNRTFSGCVSLESLDLSDIDFSGVTTQNSFLKNNYNLRNFSGVNVSCDLNLSSLYSLTHQSAVNVLTALPTVGTSKTVTFFSDVKNKLTGEEIAIATAKGWTVA